MRDITSTFIEFARPDRKRRLPSEAASAEMFEGVREAMHGDAAALPTKGVGGAGMGAKMLAGGLEGLSKMSQSTPMPMSPVMMGDPVQLQEMAISQATGLPGYYQGGRIRRGQAGVVGDEIVEVDEEGATVTPARRDGTLADIAISEQATPEGMTYDDVDAVYPNASMRPDLRGLMSGEQYGVEQTEDPLATKEAELAEAMKLKPSGWKDFGFSLVQGLNNYFNGAKDNRTYSEIKRDRRVAQIAPQVEILRQQKAREQEAIDTGIKRRYQTAQAANLEAQPGDRDAERERKTAADEMKYNFQIKTLDWKKEDREKYWEWEQVKHKALQDKDKRNYDLAVRKQTEIERANKADEGLKGQKEARIRGKEQIALEAKQAATQLKNAKTAAEIKILTEKLRKLKAESEGKEMPTMQATGEARP